VRPAPWSSSVCSLDRGPKGCRVYLSPDAEASVPKDFFLDRTGSITTLGRGQSPRGGGEAGARMCGASWDGAGVAIMECMNWGYSDEAELPVTSGLLLSAGATDSGWSMGLGGW
jgi:hypothetical protein